MRAGFRVSGTSRSSTSLALPVGAGIALAWANLAPESYFRMAGRLAFSVNDVAMVLFFGWITKEIVEAVLPGGVLHSWRRTAMPIVASAAVVIVPALAYSAAVRIFEEPLLEQAWPVAAATDLAAGYFVARVIFGKSAAVPFFLLLAMSADAIGFGMLAAFGSLRERAPGHCRADDGGCRRSWRSSCA